MRGSRLAPRINRWRDISCVTMHWYVCARVRVERCRGQLVGSPYRCSGIAVSREAGLVQVVSSDARALMLA